MRVRKIEKMRWWQFWTRDATTLVTVMVG